MQLSGESIKAQAAEAVRAMIMEGTLEDGARINEVRLAARLGVSRTPLREGLSQLVVEKMVRAAPRRGFFVCEFSIDEFQQLYDTRPLLDPAALKAAGLPAEAQIVHLEALNGKFLNARSAARAAGLDEEWHLALLSHSKNDVLMDLVRNVMMRMRRYEAALFRETRAIRNSNDEHAEILAALRREDLDGACLALARNVQSGRAEMLDWLSARKRS
ncbi:MAG: GntR family transcriptional regulator [Parvularculaceae bacterium]